MPWHVAKSAACPASRPWAVIKDADGDIEGCHPSKAAAADQMAALYANESGADRMTDIETRRIMLAPIDSVEWRASGAGKGQMTVAGHAAVFNRTSHDLGGFREIVAPGAFSAALDADPDVHLLWDHDTSLVLGRTRNKTLELRQDPLGLHFWARVAPTSYAEDLRVLMERGDVDQASFAFTVEEDDWTADEETGDVTRTIRSVGELFDVTITAKGAYPTTDASLRTLLEAAIADGRIPDLSARTVDAEPAVVDVDADDEGEPQAADAEDTITADDEPLGDADQQDDDAEARRRLLRELKAETRQRLSDARKHRLDIMRGLNR